MSGTTFDPNVKLVKRRLGKKDTQFWIAIPIQKSVAVAYMESGKWQFYRTISETLAVSYSNATKTTAAFWEEIQQVSPFFINFPLEIANKAIENVFFDKYESTIIYINCVTILEYNVTSL